MALTFNEQMELLSTKMDFADAQHRNKMEYSNQQHMNRMEEKELEHEYKKQDKIDNIAHKTLSSIFGGANVNSAGSLKQNAGVLQGVKEPVVILRRKKKFQPPEGDIAYDIGLPSNQCVTIKTLKGFTRIKAVHLEIDGATDDELSMINSLLKKGVII